MSLVIPTKNEALNITWVLERVPPCVDEIVIVDGQSTDGTVETARRTRPDVVVVHEHRPGKGAALRAGFAVARGTMIVIIDADGSMDPREIDRYIALLDTGYDLVKGSRFMPGAGSADITPLRRFGNGVFRSLANLMCRTRFSDLCYGYLAFHRSHLSTLDLDADGFEIEAQIIMRAWAAGLHMTEVPSVETPRHNGVSNLRTFSDGKRVLRTLLRERASNLQPPSPGLLDLEVLNPGSEPATPAAAERVTS